MAPARIEAVQGDITAQAVDAIVNAANTTLLGGGAGDGRFPGAAARSRLGEFARLGGGPPGPPRITGGYRLPARSSSTRWGPARAAATCGATSSPRPRSRAGPSPTATTNRYTEIAVARSPARSASLARLRSFSSVPGSR